MAYHYIQGDSKELHGLKFRENNILKMIHESLSVCACPGQISVRVKSTLENESLFVDHEKIVAALIDLERNAMEAMPDGGRLTISVQGEMRCITLWLTDTGKGIPEENLPFLFTPFFTTKPVGDGTGLGLPSAFATVKAHSGDISIESNADPKKGATGTTVKITLPRRQVFQEKEAKVVLHEE